MTGFELSFQMAPGANLGYVKQTLRGLATEGRNVGLGLAGSQAFVAVNRYLQWVSGAEAQLQNIIVEPEVWTRLRGETFWHIRELNDSSPRWQELIYTETELQARRIDDLCGEVEALEAHLDASEGRLAVIDTNVLEHQRPEQVKWSEVVKVSPVRLVIPLRVLEELDEKKYTARDDKADRARRLLTTLWTVLGPAKGGPVPIAEGVTVDRRPRRRTVDADQEFIDTCETIRSVGGSVVLVTGDYGMAIRASALGIAVEMMPEKYLRRKIDPLGS